MQQKNKNSSVNLKEGIIRESKHKVIKISRRIMKGISLVNNLDFFLSMIGSECFSAKRKQDMIYCTKYNTEIKKEERKEKSTSGCLKKI